MAGKKSERTSKGRASAQGLQAALGALGREADRPLRFGPAGWAGALVLVLVVALAVGLAWLAARSERASLTAELEQRLSIQAQRKADVISSWLEGRIIETGRLAQSDLFRLFASEIEMSGGDLTRLLEGDDGALPGDETPGSAVGSFGVPLVEQLPYMNNLLSDFVAGAAYRHGYLVSAGQKVAYVTSNDAPPLREGQLALVEQVLDSGRPRLGQADGAADGLLVDLAVPVMPEGQPGSDIRPASVFLFTLPVAARVAETLASDPLAAAGERTRLVQVGPDGRAVEIGLDLSPPLRPLPGQVALKGERLPFGERQAIDAPLAGDSRVYSAGVAVPRSSWWVVVEQNARAAEAGLRTFTYGVWAIAIMVALALLALMGAFWWRLASGHNRALAEQYRDLAGQIAAQKRLLDGILDSIVEHVGLKDRGGRYKLVNRAFADAVGRPAEQIEGLDDAALYGQGTAERLKLSDKRALSGGQAVSLGETLWLDNQERHFEISKVPLVDDDGITEGVVSVARDVTREVEERARHQRLIDQMVTALVRAVEQRDPYLAGHSRRVAGFSVAVAETLGLGAADQETLRIAANLCQIGKLGVPRAILTKPTALSEEERQQLLGHVEQARLILRDIDFELPVVETIAQMHERIDGQGYPHGLAGDNILRTAQILGLCDWFCARIEPRAHRAPISPEEALQVLHQQSDRYAPALVEALAKVRNSVSGDKLIASISPVPALPRALNG